ncbi:hypothetical protein [Bradyrhizobium iriomotense]|uniref:hypothetical protein n=1 Tax=Bradyrhizobium iriomotense TaxID=441950 RepID=UPI003D67FCE8
MAAVVMLALVPAGAVAQERAGDAALGAVSGAIVLGPVGAVAGAFVGYAAGPSIARSWGLRGSRSATSRQRARREANRVPSSASPAPAPVAPTPASATPGPTSSRAMEANGRVAQMGPASTPPAHAAPAAPAAPTQTSMPAAQGFE